jgi:hypothetical protein
MLLIGPPLVGRSISTPYASQSYFDLMTGLGKLCCFLVCAVAIGCTSDPVDPPQTSVNVDGYAVTSFEGSWDSLRTATSTVAKYIGGPGDGKYSLALPFNFPYDGDTIAANTFISVGANGAISLYDSAIPPRQLVGDSSYPGIIAPFNGELKQGNDKKAGVEDTLGLYNVTGTAPSRVLTIEYRAFHLKGGGNQGGLVDTLTSMQVKLYETTGVIEFIYRDNGLDLPTKWEHRMCAGLNGLSMTAFKSKAHVKDTKVIPATDIRWTPGRLQ